MHQRFLWITNTNGDLYILQVVIKIGYVMTCMCSLQVRQNQNLCFFTCSFIGNKITFQQFPINFNSKQRFIFIDINKCWVSHGFHFLVYANVNSDVIMIVILLTFVVGDKSLQFNVCETQMKINLKLYNYCIPILLVVSVNL